MSVCLCICVVEHLRSSPTHMQVNFQFFLSAVEVGGEVAEDEEGGEDEDDGVDGYGGVGGEGEYPISLICIE